MLRAVAKSLIAQLPFQLKYELFYQASRSLVVTGYQVAGEQGAFFGSQSDQSANELYLRDRRWSRNIIELFKKFFARSKAGTFYDMGSYIGLILMPIAKNRSVKCVGFEPAPANFNLLSANFAVDFGSRVEIGNVAVADKVAGHRFTRNAFNSGDRQSADGEM